MESFSLPPVGLGTAGITDPDQCRRTVETALELGYRHLDTAQMYENEAAVGAGLAASPIARDAVTVATKVHPTNLGPDAVIATTTESLDKLALDRVDLLYVHWPTDAYDPATTLPAFDELVDQGFIDAVAVSNFSPAQLLEATDHLDAPIVANQVELHPLLQQERLRSFAREHDITIVAYSPIMKGQADTVPELVAIANKHGVTPTQVALAWVTSLEGVVAVPKSTDPDHLQQNLEAPSIDLDDADRDRIAGIERGERLVSRPGAPWTEH